MKKTIFIIALLGIFTFVALASGFLSVDALVPDVLTELQEVTHLELTQGAVQVNGQAAEDGTPLHEGDTIELESTAVASLVFFDGSVSRLRGGTKITITKLTGTDPESTASQVELELGIGKVWSKVIKLINNESTFSVATNEVAATVRGSAFDVEVSESGNTTVMATEHSLSLQKVAHSGVQTGESVLIVEGQKATSHPRIRRPASELVAKTESGETPAPTPTTAETSQASEPRPAPPALSAVRFKIEEISEEEKQTTWFQTNQRFDDQHEIAVREEIERVQEEAVGALPGTMAYRVKDIRDTILLATTRKPEKLAEVQAKIAERKILEAQVMLRQGATTQADEQIAEAKELLSELSETKQAVTDPQAKIELEQMLTSSIDNSKQLTKLTTALDRDYQIKEFIDEAEVAMAPTEKKEEIKKEQYQRRIIEAYDLSKKKQTAAADKVVKKLAQDIKDDFTAPKAEKAISEASLKNLVANPYLNAVTHRVEVVEAQQLAAAEEAAAEETEEKAEEEEEDEEAVEEKAVEDKEEREDKDEDKDESEEEDKDKEEDESEEETLAEDPQLPERSHAAAPETETSQKKTADHTKEEKKTEAKNWLEKKVKETNRAAAKAKRIRKQETKKSEDDSDDEDYFFPADNVILVDPVLTESELTPDPSSTVTVPDSAGTTNPTTDSNTGTVQSTPTQVDTLVTTPDTNPTSPATSDSPTHTDSSSTATAPDPAGTTSTTTDSSTETVRSEPTQVDTPTTDSVVNTSSPATSDSPTHTDSSSTATAPDSAETGDSTVNSNTETVRSEPTQVDTPTTDSVDDNLSPDSSHETPAEQPTQTDTETSTRSHDLWKNTEDDSEQQKSTKDDSERQKSTEDSSGRIFNFSDRSITIPDVDFGTVLQQYWDHSNFRKDSTDSFDKSSQLSTESNMLFTDLLRWLQPALYPTR